MKINEILSRGNLKIEEANSLSKKMSLLGLEYISESNDYQRIPKTQMSARFDKGNTNTLTKDHAHVFAKPNGLGKQLFAINVDGTGHDGSSGTAIPKKVGEFLITNGYAIPLNYVVESMSLSAALKDTFIIFIVFEQ